VDIIFFIVLGGLWGSFANVCIYRLPINKNIALGRSFCTNCKIKIAWFDNIPVLSYLILRSKCRNCKKKISFQYFLVELLGILNFTVIYLLFGITLTTILLIILSLAFLIIFFIDLRHYIIPNSITYPMMILGFIKSFDPNLNSIFPNYMNSLIGGIFGYAMIWSIIYFYKQIKKKDGMGLGDAKLFAVIGFWFGWISIPFIIFLSSIIALIYVLPDLLKNSKKMSSQIPFGPFIIIGTIFYLVFQDYFVQLL
jgi:leader peptidase (prepilin peptidase)/N-methyltransferase